MMYVEYFRFEAAMISKIKTRKRILMGQGDDGNLKFLGDEEADDGEVEKQGMLDSSCTILEIILDTI